MSIEKYITEAFILQAYENGEDDLVYKVWTREFGVIFVLAKSVRKIEAKLRIRMEKNNFLNLTLIKGKHIWRLTGVEETVGHLKPVDKFTAETKFLIAEASHRFLEENVPYKKLFDRLRNLTLASQAKTSRLEIKRLKVLIYYLILVDTGYADARLIGVEGVSQYAKLSTNDLLTFFVLNQKDIQSYLVSILKENML